MHTIYTKNGILNYIKIEIPGEVGVLIIICIYIIKDFLMP